MRHRKKTLKLGRTASHRKALMNNMVASLILAESVKTTDTRAKALKSYAEHIIHLAKDADISRKRQLIKILNNRNAYNKLLQDIVTRYADRTGGYVRVVKLGFRKGDGSPTAIVELVQ